MDFFQVDGLWLKVPEGAVCPRCGWLKAEHGKVHPPPASRLDAPAADPLTADEDADDRRDAGELAEHYRQHGIEGLTPAVSAPEGGRPPTGLTCANDIHVWANINTNGGWCECGNVGPSEVRAVEIPSPEPASPPPDAPDDLQADFEAWNTWRFKPSVSRAALLALVTEMKAKADQLCPVVAEPPARGWTPIESHCRIIGAVLADYAEQLAALLTSETSDPGA